MDLDLKGKVAIITGGGRGIGKAAGRSLAREGVDIALASRDRAVLEATRQQIEQESGVKVRAYPTETGDDASVKALVEGVMRDFGRIDILVNAAATAAGQSKPPKLSEITNEAFFAELNTKVLGYVRTAREAAPHMTKPGGRIINISGLAARTTGSIIGSIRNIGVAATTKNLADELAPLGITAICIHPGNTRTEKTAALIERRAREEGVSTAEIEKRMGGGSLAKRIIDAEEVGDVIALLASPKAAIINGDVITAGGGMPGTIYY